MQAALAQLADNERPEILTFPDFPALVVACAQAALGGGLGSAWHWRMMGVPSAAGPGEAIATLLIAFPLEAGSAVAVLAERGLLGPVWRDMPEDAANRLSDRLGGGRRVFGADLANPGIGRPDCHDFRVSQDVADTGNGDVGGGPCGGDAATGVGDGRSRAVAAPLVAWSAAFGWQPDLAGAGHPSCRRGGTC